jgi:hypothetical protein
MAQIPLAGLLATDYLYQQSFRRYSRYLTHVSTLLAFRPAASSGRDDEDVVADVISEELIGAAAQLVLDFVTLPSETGRHFTQQTEEAVREIQRRIQPDADVDTRRYVENELEKINAEIYRLRGVASAETRAAIVSKKTGRRRSDSAAFKRTLTAMRDAIPPDPSFKRAGGGSGTPRSTAHERTLDVLQAVVARALDTLKVSPPAQTSTPDKDVLRLRSRAQRLSAVVRNAQDEIARAKDELADEIEAVEKSPHTSDARGRRRSSKPGV